MKLISCVKEQMDEDVKKLLREWGLGAYIEKFAENKIELSTLNLLDAYLVKELIAPVGDRAIFLKNLETWKTLTYDILKSNEVQDIDDNYVDMLSDHHRNITLSSLNTSAPKKQTPYTEGQLQCSENRTFQDLTNISITSKDSDIELEVICPSTSTLKPLKELLQSSLEGKGLLNLYHINGKLSNCDRRKLCNIVVKNLLENDPDKRIDSKILLERAQEIKVLFPKENVSTYFIPYIHNKELKIKRCAKGKLYDCLQNRRREYKNSKAIKTKQSPDLKTSTSNVSDEICKDDLLWLESCCEPWNILVSKWKRTAEIRLKELTGGSNITINDYMSKYPALKKPTGFHLFVEDFKVLYPEQENKLFENFALCKKRIITYALEKFKNTQDLTINSIIEHYHQLAQTSNDAGYEEATSIIAFMLLPLILGNPLAKNKKGSWRPSKLESRDGFITHITQYMKLAETVCQRKEKFAKLHITFQPTIFIVGPSITKIETYYIVVNETYFQAYSITETVDICFKIFHSLHCQYPVESVSTWMFIQKGFYYLTTKWDKNYSTVNALLTDLEINID